MRKLAVVLFATITSGACGDSKATPDAAIVKIIDARPIDAVVIPDSPPIDAQTYDFTCLGKPEPTTAPAQITISGTVQELKLGNPAAVAGASVQSFKTGNAQALDTVTSAADGSFTSGNLATGGMPLDGYVEAKVPMTGGANDYRATFVYPPAPLAKNLANAPVPLITNATFAQFGMFLSFTQDDTNNGVVIVVVSDCANTPIDGATLSVKQGSADVGDIKALPPAQAPGTFLVANVPAGTTSVGATFGGHTFPVHSVTSYKKDVNSLPNGSLTLTILRPGPMP